MSIIISWILTVVTMTSLWRIHETNETTLLIIKLGPLIEPCQLSICVGHKNYLHLGFIVPHILCFWEPALNAILLKSCNLNGRSKSTWVRRRCCWVDQGHQSRSSSFWTPDICYEYLRVGIVEIELRSWINMLSDMFEYEY